MRTKPNLRLRRHWCWAQWPPETHPTLGTGLRLVTRLPVIGYHYATRQLRQCYQTAQAATLRPHRDCLTQAGRVSDGPRQFETLANWSYWTPNWTRPTLWSQLSQSKISSWWSNERLHQKKLFFFGPSSLYTGALMDLGRGVFRLKLRQTSEDLIHLEGWDVLYSNMYKHFLLCITVAI